MKVLFLDIDGVLNNEATKEQIELPGRVFDKFTGLDARLVTILKDWLAAHPEVQVVISSTWRLEDHMLAMIKNAGIRYISVTRNLGQRGKEVDDWLAINRPTHYAILDDIQWFAAHHQKHFVQTSYIHGLREKNLREIERILGLEKSESTAAPAQGAGPIQLPDMAGPGEESPILIVGDH